MYFHFLLLMYSLFQMVDQAKTSTQKKNFEKIRK